MIVELREEGGDVLRAVVELPGGAEIVVSDYSGFRDEVADDDEDGLVTVFEGLKAWMLETLAFLGMAGVEVYFLREAAYSSKAISRAMDRAVENGPSPAVITPGLVERVRRAVDEEEEKKAEYFGKLARRMEEEGLKRGLNKEERQNMTVREAFRPNERESRGRVLVEHFEAEHRRRIDESVAVIGEMLPTNEEELAQVRAEYRDGLLCDDPDLMARTDEEVDKRMNVHGRLGALWLLMSAAQDSRDEALSKATTAEIRATVHQEFRRREKL